MLALRLATRGPASCNTDSIREEVSRLTVCVM